MREKWIVEAKKGDFNGLSAKLKVSPLAVRCLMNRGVESEQEMQEVLYGTLDDLHDPFFLLPLLLLSTFHATRDTPCGKRNVPNANSPELSLPL